MTAGRHTLNAPAWWSRITAEASANDAVLPYGDGAPGLIAAGWTDVLPLPRGRKEHPPSGFTGRAGATPKEVQLRAWLDGQEHRGNIALRLPSGVIAIDVDAYGAKVGSQTLSDLEAKLGFLPPTWGITNRDDGSGHRLFRVPDEGLRWPGFAGPGIDIIQHKHRYCVAPPSLHPEGRLYVWVDPTGRTRWDKVPSPGDLAALPDAWVAALTGGEIEESLPRIEVDGGGWLTEHGAGVPDSAVAGAVSRATAAFEAGEAGRHDTACRTAYELAALAAEGHSGVATALNQVRTEFVQRVTTESDKARRSVGAATAEWNRVAQSAIEHAAARATLSATAPFAPTEDAVASWQPVDLAAALDGDPAPGPLWLHREDRQALLYAGKLHALIGESESGKSWIAQAAVAECLCNGGTALIVDFESDELSVSNRLLALGVPRELLTDVTCYRYVRSEARPTSALESVAFEALFAGRVDVAVVDGVTDALGLWGWKGIDNDDVAQFYRTLPHRLARQTNAAVVLVDHVTKGGEDRGRYAIGAQHKLSGLSGAAFTVEVVKPFGRGLEGMATLRVGKDRPGHLRGVAGAFRKSDRTQLVADFHLNATDPNELVWTLLRPDGPTFGEGAAGEETVTPTERVAQKIRDWLGVQRLADARAKQAAEGWRSTSAIRGSKEKRGAGVNHKLIGDALALLVKRAEVETKGIGQAHLFRYGSGDDGAATS